MNEVQVFAYEDAVVRTVQKDGETWWILKDVCNVLGIGNTTDVAYRLEEDEKTTFASIECSSDGEKPTLASIESFRKDTVLISESGLYSVILRSDKSEAKPFRKWVTSEVLPAIRKTGAYLAASASPGLSAEQFAAQALESIKALAYELAAMIREQPINANCSPAPRPAPAKERPRAAAYKALSEAIADLRRWTWLNNTLLVGQPDLDRVIGILMKARDSLMG